MPDMDELQEAAAPTGDGWTIHHTWIAAPDEAEAPDSAPIEYRDRALFNAHWHPDGGGNAFQVFTTLQGNTTLGQVHKLNAAGVQVGYWEIAPPTNFKFDSFSVEQTGAHLMFAATAHEAISAPDRRNIYATYPLLNVAAPYPQGTEARGKLVSDALLGGTSEPPPDSGLTKADVQAAVVDALKQVLGTADAGQVFNRFVDAARRGVLAAGLQLPANLLTEPKLREILNTPSDLYHSDGLYARLVETQYQVLRDNDVLAASAHELGKPWPPLPKAAPSDADSGDAQTS